MTDSREKQARVRNAAEGSSPNASSSDRGDGAAPSSRSTQPELRPLGEVSQPGAGMVVAAGPHSLREISASPRTPSGDDLPAAGPHHLLVEGDAGLPGERPSSASAPRQELSPLAWRSVALRGGSDDGYEVVLTFGGAGGGVVIAVQHCGEVIARGGARSLAGGADAARDWIAEHRALTAPGDRP